MAGAGIRLYDLAGRSIGIDEVYSLSNAQVPVADIIHQPAFNTNIPPLYYVLLHYVVDFGQSEFLLRIPSVIFGVLTIPLFYFVVQRFVEQAAAQVSTLLFALSPFHLFYSQDARPYSLLLLLALLSILLAQRRLEQKGGAWEWFAFAIVSAAVFYCHTVGLALYPFLALYAVIISPRKNWWRWIASFAAIGILVAPGIYEVFIANGSLPAPDRPVGLASLGYLFWTFGVGFSLGPSVAELHAQNRIDILLSELPIVIPTGLLIMTLSVWGAIALARRDRSLAVVLVALFLIPVAFVYAGALLSNHPFNVRYATLAYPAFVAILGYGIVNFKWPRLAAGLVLGIVLVSIGNFYAYERYHHEDARAAATYLRDQLLPGDVVVCNAPYTWRTLDYYIGDLDQITFAPCPDEFEEYSGPEQIAENMRRHVGFRDHFWLYLSRTFHSVDAMDDLMAYCDQFYVAGEPVVWHGVKLIPYHAQANSGSDSGGTAKSAVSIEAQDEPLRH